MSEHSVAIGTVLSHLVPPQFAGVGRVSPPFALGCPTVPPQSVFCTCERSGHVRARCTRQRVFNNSLFTRRKSNKGGTVGRGFVFGLRIRPTSFKRVGQVGRLNNEQMAVVMYSPTLLRCWCCIAYILVGGVKSGLLPVNSTCKKYTSSIGATA